MSEWRSAAPIPVGDPIWSSVGAGKPIDIVVIAAYVEPKPGEVVAIVGPVMRTDG